MTEDYPFLSEDEWEVMRRCLGLPQSSKWIVWPRPSGWVWDAWKRAAERKQRETEGR